MRRRRKGNARVAAAAVECARTKWLAESDKLAAEPAGVADPAVAPAVADPAAAAAVAEPAGAGAGAGAAVADPEPVALSAGLS